MTERETPLASSRDTKRTRRAHTRSRNGCVICRQRRVRCDEKLPTCGNCIVGKRPCSYTHDNIPLRERRATKRPGEQQPWSSHGSLTAQSSPSAGPVEQTSMAASLSFKLVLGEALDPFDTMHFKMPFKSKELFHYFYHAGSTLGNVPGTQKFITANIHDPYVFRNTLLIAGLHYAWNIGDLATFDSTFLFHKVQSIRTINAWIEECSSSSLTLCVRHIATLCVVECCLGDFATAETHLNGLMLLLDTKGAYEMVPRTPKEDLEREFAERYLIILKSRFDDFMVSNLSRVPSSKHMDTKEVAHLIHEWHMHEVVGIAPRLRAMNMFPSFLSPIDEGVQSQHVDVEPILCCMREITAAYDSRYSEAEHGTDRASQYYLWASSGPSKLLSAVIDAHISSITDNTEKNNSGLSPKVKSSWSGICIAVGLYLTSVLGVWNQGHPPENRLLYHNLRILRQDLDDNLADIMGEDIFAQQLWFWKAFLGALSLAHAGFVADEGVVRYKKLLDLVPVFNRYLQTSARRMGFKRWQYARTQLGMIVFPTYFRGQGLVQILWDQALSASI
ncbi:Hypothetical protein PENO1_064800 [Penicillium occitanis (nom. inval.)]|nr:Hypothetical protein PENO1_064800 [Penicillium occitanis (nom. inval.)]PCG97510.1 hypothetical protein PENOC_067490 [Penicillium occitanis (nom. inval.)]